MGTYVSFFKLNSTKFSFSTDSFAYSNSTSGEEKEINLDGAKGVLICNWNGDTIYQNPTSIPIVLFVVGTTMKVSYGNGIVSTFQRTGSNKVKLTSNANYALLYVLK